jgi:hypothetical protein
MTPEIQKVPDLTTPLPLSLTNSTSSIPESPHLLPKRESSTPQLLPQKLQTKTLSINPESKNDKSLDLTLLKPSHLLQNKRPKAIANPPEPTKSSDIFESKPVKQIGKIEILPSSERLQQEINIKRVPHVDVVEEPISVKREKFKPKRNSDKPDLPSQTNSIMLTSSSPKPIWYNEPFDPSKNVTDQSKISKKRRLEMTANTTESTMNPAKPKNKPETSAEKYQTEENSKKPKNVNSSINSQSTTVKPILLNSYLIKSNLPNEPVDSSKNVSDQSNTSKKLRPEMIANAREPSMDTGMSKNKPETSSEKYQREEKSKEAQNVNSSINSQSTTVKPILLNSYLIKSNLPNEPVDSFKNTAGQSNTSKKPRPEMTANTTEPTMNPGMFKNKPETSSEKYQREEKSKEPQNVNSSINSQSTIVKPILLNSYLIKSNLPNEPVDSFKNTAGQSNTSKKPRPEMTANTTEPTMNPGMFKNKPETSSEKYQREEKSTEAQNVNSSINSQSTTVKPILLNSYLIKSNLPNEPVDSFKNAAGQSNTSKKPRPEITANTTEPTMNPGMFKNKPETSSEKYQREEKSKEPQNVNSSINSQSTIVKPILLNSYLIKSNLPNEPVDSFKNTAGQSNTSKKPRPEMTANTTEPTMNPGMFKNKPETSSEKYQREEKSTEAQNVNSSINSQSTTVKPILLNSYLIKSNLPNEPVDSFKNAAGQSNTSKKPRPEITANTTEPTMNPGMFKNKPETSSEKYQREEKSKEPQNVNSSINSQSTIVKPILLNSYLIKSNLPNEPVDSFKNTAGQSNTSKKPRPEMTANTTEPTMNPGMFKNKPETSSEKYQREEKSTEAQNVNSSINSQSTTVKPILLNSYLIKSNLPNEPVDSFKNAAGQSNTSKKPRPEMTANTTEPTMNPGMFKNKPETSSEKYQREEKSKEPQNVNSSINSQSTIVKPILLNSYLIKSNLPNEPVDSFKNIAGQSNTSKKPRPEMTANTTEPTMNPGMFKNKPETSSEKYQREEKSKEPQNVNSSINSQSTIVKPILLNSYLIKSNLPNEPVDSFKNTAGQSNTSKKKTSSENFQTEKNSKEPQDVNSSINSQSTTVKPIFLNTYFIKPIPSNEPVDPFNNVAEPSKASEEQEPATSSERYKSTTNFNNPLMPTSPQLLFDSESTELDALSLLIAKLVADFKNLRSLPDYEKSQLVVDSDNQQPVVRSSISPPVVDSEDSQPEFDSGIPQPVVTSSSPQPVVDFESPQLVAYSEIPQPVVVSGTPHPALTSSIPHTVIDSGISQPVVDPGTPQPGVVSGTQQPAVASSNPQPAVDSETPQSVVDSGTQQPAVVSSIPQPIVDSEIPQLVIDTGTPQSIVNYGTQQIAVASSTPQPAVDPETPQSVVDPGTQQPPVASSNLQLAVDSGTPQSAVDSGTQQSVVDSGTQKPAVVSSISQPIMDSEIPQLVIDPGTPQPIVESGTQQPAVASSTPQFAVDSETPQSVVDSGTQQPAVASSNLQLPVDSGTPQSAIDSGTQQSVVDSGTPQPEVVSGTPQPALTSSFPHTPIDSGIPQPVVDPGTQQPAVLSSIPRPIVNSEIPQLVIDHGTPQYIVNYGTQQPAVASSTPQFTVDSETTQSVVDSGTQQPAVVSSIPQPVVDSEIPQLAIDPVTPQSIVNSGTQQAAVDSGTPQSSAVDSGTQQPSVVSSISQTVVDSGTQQSVVDSGTQHPAVVSSIPQPILDSEIPQLVIDPGTPQLIAVAFSISQSAVDFGTSQSVDDSGTQQPSVAASISQPVLDSGTQQPVVDSGTQQTAVASSTVQSVVDSGTQKSSVASLNPQAVLDSGTQLSVVNSGTQQPSVAFSIPQTVLDSGTPLSVVESETQQPAVADSISQHVVDPGTPQPVVDSGTQQPAVESGTIQSVFDSGTQQPSVASSIPQPLGDSGTPQSVDDSGTQQPAVAYSISQPVLGSETQQPSVASSIPQPLVDSGTPQSVVVSETPQLVFNSKGPQQSPHTDKSQPGLGSKGSQKFPHSDKSQPGGSKGPQQIIHSDKSQLGADSKGPQQSDKSQSGVDSKGPQQSPHSDKSEPGGSKESQKSPHSDKSKPGLGPNGSPQSTHSDKSEPPGNSRESKPSPGLKKPAKPSSSGELIN